MALTKVSSGLISADASLVDLNIDAGTLYIDATNNRVGVKNQTPTVALDVTGDLVVSASATLGTTSVGQLTFTSLTNTTTDIPEGSKLFFTEQRVLDTAPSGSLGGTLGDVTVQYRTDGNYSGTPNQGSFYFDALNSRLKVYTGSEFIDTIPFTAGGGGGATTEANATFFKYQYTVASETNTITGADIQEISSGAYVIGKSYEISVPGTTDFTALGSADNISGTTFTATATGLVVGGDFVATEEYTIVSVDDGAGGATTDFTLIGAADNDIGTTFTATGVGAGTGFASQGSGTAHGVLGYSTSSSTDVVVFVNGVKQRESSVDGYQASTGTNIAFTYNLPVDSVVDVQVYELLKNDAYYTKAQTYTQTETNTQISTALSTYDDQTASDTRYVNVTGDTMTGNLGVTGTVTADGLTVSAPAGDTPASIVTTTAGSFLEFTDVNTTAGRSPLVGAITDGLAFYTSAGSYSEKLRIDSLGGITGTSQAGGHVVFNETGVDADFRVESDTNANAFWVDASTNQVRTDAVFVHDADGSNQPFYITRSGGLDQALKVTLDDNNVMLTSAQDETSGANFIFYSTNATTTNLTLAQFDYSSGTVFNEDGVNYQNFRIESDADAHAFYVNAVNGYVGINAGSAPQQPLGVGTSAGSGLNYWLGTANVIQSDSGIKVSRSTTNDATVGSGLNLSNTSSTNTAMSPMIHFSARSASDTYSTTYAGIWGRKQGSGTDANWNVGDIEFGNANSAGLRKRMSLSYLGGLVTFPTTAGHAVFNEDGADADFRVESDTNTHALFVDASTDRVGILDSTPVSAVDIVTGNGAPGDSGSFLSIKSGTGNLVEKLNLGVNSTSGYAFIAAVRPGISTRELRIQPNGGGTTFNDDGNNQDFRVESDNNSNMFVINGGVDKIGMGRSANLRDVVTITGANSDTSFGTTTAALEITNSDNSVGHFSALNFRVAAGNYEESLATVSAKYSSYSGNVRGQLSFGTRGASTTNVSERMRIDEFGKVFCYGDVAITGASLVGAGSAASPSISFSGDTNTGLYSGGADNINFATGGTARAFMSASQFNMTGNGVFSGSISKGSGSFKIDHPLPEKTETHHLVHSFVESPQADNIYRGKVDLVDGSATVNIDDAAGMTEGTYVLLNTNTQCFTSNESGWTAVKGSVSGNILTITAQESCTDTISWMVVGERHDQHMLDTEWTDENGKVIVEPLKKLES